MSYLIYLSICFAASASPGPAVLLAVKNGARFGAKRALIGCLGNISAMMTMATLSVVGLGAIITASATLFTVVKVIGGAYLIYLGVSTWRNQSQSFATENPVDGHSVQSITLFREAYMVGISNPKAIAFYTALFPQFLDLNSAMLPQFLLLASTFAVVSFSCLSSYAILATRIRTHLRKSRFSSWFHRITGSIFIGFGIGLLSQR